MKFLKIMKEGFRVYSLNLATFVLAVICATAGSIFIVTAPPLLFGLYYMGAKAARDEEVELKDLLQGFKMFISSWTYVIVVLTLLLTAPSIAYYLLSYLKISVVASFLVVISVLICWITLVTYSLVYAIPLIAGEDKKVFDAIKTSIKTAFKKFTTTVSLFISLTLITVFIGWIPVFGPLVVIPYQIITYSKAAQEI
ncbi:MAG: hypothetical protein ABH834_05900 [Candidatus Altiarchaeota archaeon]